MEAIMNALIRTGKKKFGLSFDSENELLIIEITENPEKGKANKEIIKELKKFFKSEIELVSGLKSKKKRIKISLPKQEVLNLLNNTN
ncbi:putative ACR, YggU family [uncultured archaeon]|nr:putative ACR, YggU family [uncultured archaeon]